MKRFSIGLITGLIAGLVLATTTLVFAGDTIKLLVNNRQIYSDVPPQIISGRTMIPARALAESLGAQVTWDESTSSVIVTRHEVTKIVEPKPLNTTGQVQITGPSDFKESVGKALALLKEKSPEDYNLVTGFVNKVEDKVLSGNSLARMISTTGNIYIDWSKYTKYAQKVNQSDKIYLLCGTLVHESYHIYLSLKGLPAMPKMFLSNEEKHGISVLEDEILAFLRERQTYNKLGAPKYILDATSLDRVADTNYYNTILPSFQ